jgi:hypothetical protein
MEIPKKIKIGRRFFRVKNDWKGKKRGDNEVYGDINFPLGRIRVSNNRKDGGAEMTLFHEISHAIIMEIYNQRGELWIRNLVGDEDFIDNMGEILKETFNDLLKAQIKD